MNLFVAWGFSTWFPQVSFLFNTYNSSNVYNACNTCNTLGIWNERNILIGSSTWFLGSRKIGGCSYHRWDVPAIRQHLDQTCDSHGDDWSLNSQVLRSWSSSTVKNPWDLSWTVTAETNCSTLGSLVVAVEVAAVTFVSFDFNVVDAAPWDEVTASLAQKRAL